jgi:2-polyprenyl-3-methyl-5-hydroxy-6-metoxy-1,4-benzoquinol methylase
MSPARNANAQDLIVPVNQLKNVETHFAFGKNWASYAARIDEARIEEATKGLLKLIPAVDFKGKSFLDIGCGSGLSALAAAQLGVDSIVAIDIDPVSVATTRAVLSSNNVSVPWRAETMSVFELDAMGDTAFNIVYSWGVLHHTGAMWEALNKSASMVAPNGLLAIALYRRTYLDPFWKLEKRLYAHAPHVVQTLVRGAYVAAFRLGLWATGRSFRDYLANYKSARGMDFYIDVHDWLGGYPYESVLAPELESTLASRGFAAERVFSRPQQIGLFGSGCDEYVYRLTR